MSLTAAILFNDPAPKFKGKVRTNYIDRPPRKRENGGGGNQEEQRITRERNTRKVLDALKEGFDTTKGIAEEAGLSSCTVRMYLKRLESEGVVASSNPGGKSNPQVFWELVGHA